MQRRSVTIRSIAEVDWREYRSLRLEMLQDFPIAYGETFEHASRQPESEWRMRARRGQDPRNCLLVAIDDATMTWVGTMGGYLPPSGVPLLVGVYVAASHRGRAAGVGDGLLDGVEEWARDFGDTLELDVHEDNPRAIRFYERHGFRDTGNRIRYDLPPGGLEWRMAKPLA
ncbi:GNAT family N-acetyltransferase [Frondihabitans australicus]|uniref:Ribosomal protein S18 acetylase RimI-like enzyme n=1 Tax=Frondihabitans australicus TaxID=386892 RepID=A0A495IKB1_9MICO|nr:GNAT family N-acetyltransferase [Frondihabitans australicus]RKR76404.1 ribosomal protein S18 acetylase RimI-like enzyme [Frondihabitans australicus]